MDRDSCLEKVGGVKEGAYLREEGGGKLLNDVGMVIIGVLVLEDHVVCESVS